MGQILPLLRLSEIAESIGAPESIKANLTNGVLLINRLYVKKCFNPWMFYDTLQIFGFDTIANSFERFAKKYKYRNETSTSNINTSKSNDTSNRSVKDIVDRLMDILSERLSSDNLELLSDSKKTSFNGVMSHFCNLGYISKSFKCLKKQLNLIDRVDLVDRVKECSNYLRQHKVTSNQIRDIVIEFVTNKDIVLRTLKPKLKVSLKAMYEKTLVLGELTPWIVNNLYVPLIISTRRQNPLENVKAWTEWRNDTYDAYSGNNDQIGQLDKQALENDEPRMNDRYDAFSGKIDLIRQLAKQIFDNDDSWMDDTNDTFSDNIDLIGQLVKQTLENDEPSTKSRNVTYDSYSGNIDLKGQLDDQTLENEEAWTEWRNDTYNAYFGQFDLIDQLAKQTLENQTILLIGESGIGKSFLCQYIISLYCDSKLPYKYVIYLHCGNRNWHLLEEEGLYNTSECNLKKLLKIALPEATVSYPEIFEDIVKHDGCGVLFLIDEFNQFNTKIKLEESIFWKILQRKVFSKCTLILTTRPESVQRLQSTKCLNDTFSLCLTVNGFSKQSLSQFLQKRLRIDLNSAENLISGLTNSY